jgi:hypothetical protein
MIQSAPQGQSMTIAIEYKKDTVDERTENKKQETE